MYHSIDNTFLIFQTLKIVVFCGMTPLLTIPTVNELYHECLQKLTKKVMADASHPVHNELVEDQICLLLEHLGREMVQCQVLSDCLRDIV